MYRNIHYRINDAFQGEIVLFTWDENGNRVTKVFPHNSYLYHEDFRGSVKSMFGTMLRRKDFSNIAMRRKWLSQNQECRIFENLPPAREFLLQQFESVVNSPSFATFPLRTHFLDIEVKVKNTFPEPEEAKEPVNVITIYDTLLGRYHTWTLGQVDLTGNDISTDLECFDDESKLLRSFLAWWKDNCPDVLSGWNVERFDLPYLVNRCDRILNDGEVNALSPLNEVKKSYREQRGDSMPIASYKITGVSVLDYYILYKAKFELGSKESYKLGDICADELGVTKIKNPYETIREFEEKDFTLFVKYNIRDVELCVRLDQKKKFIDLARRICNMGLVEYENIFKSQPYIYGALTLQARKAGVKLLSDSREEKGTNNEGFEGAFVFEPQVGFYHKGVTTLDLNSLYPNTIICLNISPETKIGKVVNECEEYVEIKKADGKIKRLSNADFTALKKKSIISNNKVLYVLPDAKKGIIPSFLERLYDNRKSHKKQAYNAQKKIETLIDSGVSKDDQQIKELKRQANDHEIIQGATKVVLNSIYGQIGSEHFPLYDLDNAEAVTLSGQRIIKESAAHANKLFAEMYSADTDVVICGDTDSIYLNLQSLTEKVIGSGDIKWTKGNNQKICKELDDNFVTKMNENCFRITNEIFGSPLRRIEFKRETLCSEGDFIAKKHYVLHIRDLEGLSVDKFKFVGVDVKKNELPSKIKGILADAIKRGMNEKWTSAEYKEFIASTWADFTSMKPEDLGYIKNYTTEKEVIGFLKAGSGAGAHAKGAIYYNQLVEKMNLSHKYQTIQQGDRLRYIYIKRNDYGIEVIGWKDVWPYEFNELFAVDYMTMFEKVVLSPLKGFERNHNWKRFDPTKEEITDINSL